MRAVVGGLDNQRGMADSLDYIVCQIRWTGSKQGSPSFSPPPTLLGARAEREGGRRGAVDGPSRSRSYPGGLSEPKRIGLALRRYDRLMAATIRRVSQRKTLRSNEGG